MKTRSSSTPSSLASARLERSGAVRVARHECSTLSLQCDMAATARSAEFTLRWISTVGNLLGAIVAFLYFRVVDHASSPLPPVRWTDVVISLVLFALLVISLVRLSGPWTAALNRVQELPTLPPAEAEVVRRRALLFPYFLAGLSLLGWTLAGIIWGVIWPLLAGVFTPITRSARSSATP